MRGPRGAPESIPDLRTSMALLDPSTPFPPTTLPPSLPNPTVPQL